MPDLKLLSHVQRRNSGKLNKIILRLELPDGRMKKKTKMRFMDAVKEGMKERKRCKG